MNNWKVNIIIGDRKTIKTIYIKNKEKIEEVYSTAKIWFISNNPEIDFHGVDSVKVVK